MNPVHKKTDRIFLSAPHMSGKEVEYVRQAFESNYIAPVGPQLNQFEQRFREVSGFPHCVAVSSGTAGIHLVLHSLNVKAGDVVIASTLTFIGSVSAAHHLGAELVFIDSDKNTWNMDVNLLAREIDRLVAAGRKPAAVIPTEVYGQPCELGKIVDLCSRHQIPVICDSAESLGAKYEGGSVGRLATAAVFSFNGNKIITTSGGGMIASFDESLIKSCRYLSTQARQPVTHYEHVDVGYNFRMSNVVAAIGIGQLEVLGERVEKKRQIHLWYENYLQDVEGVDFLREAAYGRSNRWLTVVTLNPEKMDCSPSDVIEALEAQNIESRPLWKPMHLQPVFQNHRCVGGEVTESLFQRGLCLPSGTIMEQHDVKRICQIIRRVITG